MLEKIKVWILHFLDKVWRRNFLTEDKLKGNAPYFPFELNKIEGGYAIIAQLESDRLYPLYYDFFKKHGYEGNGYCWEGHIEQILEKLDEDLLEELDFDPEAASFYVYADSKKAQKKFVKLLAPIFYDLEKLEIWVKRAELDRIGD